MTICVVSSKLAPFPLADFGWEDYYLFLPTKISKKKTGKKGASLLDWSRFPLKCSTVRGMVPLTVA